MCFIFQNIISHQIINYPYFNNINLQNSIFTPLFSYNTPNYYCQMMKSYIKNNINYSYNNEITNCNKNSDTPKNKIQLKNILR